MERLSDRAIAKLAAVRHLLNAPSRTEEPRKWPVGRQLRRQSRAKVVRERTR